jgi:hypothetical protein
VACDEFVREFLVAREDSEVVSGQELVVSWQGTVKTQESQRFFFSWASVQDYQGRLRFMAAAELFASQTRSIQSVMIF